MLNNQFAIYNCLKVYCNKGFAALKNGGGQWQLFIWFLSLREAALAKESEECK